MWYLEWHVEDCGCAVSAYARNITHTSINSLIFDHCERLPQLVVAIVEWKMEYRIGLAMIRPSGEARGYVVGMIIIHAMPCIFITLISSLIYLTMIIFSLLPHYISPWNLYTFLRQMEMWYLFAANMIPFRVPKYCIIASRRHIIPSICSGFNLGFKANVYTQQMKMFGEFIWNLPFFMLDLCCKWGSR